MKKLIKLGCLFLLGCLLFNGCANLNPNNFPSTNFDLARAEYYPSKAELNPKPEKMLVILAHTVGVNIGEELKEQLIDLFWKHAYIKLNFQRGITFEEALKLSKTQKIEYTSFVEQDLNSAPPKFQIASAYNPYEKMVFETSWIPASKKDTKKFQKSIKTDFPRRGFILETRDNRRFAKINLGEKDGIKKGALIAVYSREILETITPGIYKQTSIKYSTNPVAQIKVLLVEDDYSWALVKKAQQKRVQTGLPVFPFVE